MRSLRADVLESLDVAVQAAVAGTVTLALAFVLCPLSVPGALARGLLTLLARGSRP